jgi:hypothetical protein
MTELEGTSAFAWARTQVARIAFYNSSLSERTPRYRLDHIRTEVITKLLHLVWDTSDLEGAARDRGFGSVADAIDRARMFVPHSTVHGAPAYLQPIGA